MKNSMILRYSSPAQLASEDARNCGGVIAWERYSLPLGNGFFGANVFGRTEIERIQISDPTVSNPWYTPKRVERKGCSAAGVNSFAEFYLEINHTDVSDYKRTLSLDDAISTVEYVYDGVRYYRETFTSHPDRVLVLRVSADKSASVSLRLRAEIPFVGDYTVEEGDGLAKHGSVSIVENDIFIEGDMSFYGVKYFGIARVITKGGILSSSDSAVSVKSADEVTIIFSCDTNYILDESDFSEKNDKEKLKGRVVDKDAVISFVSKAEKKSYAELKERHIEDYRTLYSRVSFDLGESQPDADTDALIEEYRQGRISLYLENLLFQYGRYLLISSSRTRMPAHLQGIWNAYCDSPWSCGYWHNINVQMNYWPSGPANLSETFIPYINYAKAYMPSARESADFFIKEKYPENYSESGKNGWIIGTGAWAYEIEAFKKIGHSGPGTGAFTSLLFWDYYDFTQDVKFLREFAYPALEGMSLFFTKILTKIDGKYLIKDSASPENKHKGVHYHTIGCAFDQQMVYENFKRTIEAAEILGIRNDFITKITEILPHLDPVLIGDDGQIKEYREETTYSSIGEPNHRHISHLVGLYPATIINDTTPEWLEGAKVTLTRRGDDSTCWAAAHRLLLWARTKTPNKCRDIINSFVVRNLHNNLWCNHPPFQIDGNFGFTAGVCEMLLQSQSGYIELLPSVPYEWRTGSFSGLVARGNFVVDCKWQDGRITYASVMSRVGGKLMIKLPTDLIPDGITIEDGITVIYMKPGEKITFEK